MLWSLRCNVSSNPGCISPTLAPAASKDPSAPSWALLGHGYKVPWEHSLVVGTAQALPSGVPISLRKKQKKGKELVYPLLYLSTNVSKVPICYSDKLPWFSLHLQGRKAKIWKYHSLFCIAIVMCPTLRPFKRGRVIFSSAFWRLEVQNQAVLCVCLCRGLLATSQHGKWDPG